MINRDIEGTFWRLLRDILVLTAVTMAMFWYLMGCLGAFSETNNNWVGHNVWKDYISGELPQEETRPRD